MSLREISSPGKSGSIFYLSHDDRFVIKTLKISELKVLLRMLPRYYENTLITKYFGGHRIKLKWATQSGSKALTFSIANRSCLDDSSNPLLKRNPHQLVPFIEFELAYFPQVDALKDKGNILFSTHIPYGLLLVSVVKSGCKIVYIWRDPKDTFISMWTFFQKQKPDFGPLNSLEESFDMFCRGFSGNGPYLDHVLGYWKAYQENPEQILFLKYETMRAGRPLPYVMRLAQFMGCGFTAEEEKKRVVENVVNLCSFETLKNLEINKGEKKKREDVSWLYYPNSVLQEGKCGRLAELLDSK